ncbi:MAG: serine/threonine-protein kinase [Planctomycetota bacterium]|nr:serine/threonine-protein kinase [Planctomycetota bacterium]
MNHPQLSEDERLGEVLAIIETRSLRQSSEIEALAQDYDVAPELVFQCLRSMNAFQTVAEPETVLQVGHGFGRYQLLEEIGLGGMGRVFRAKDLDQSREVALKVLKNKLRGHRELRARFQREAKIMMRLEHPVLVKVFDVGEIEARPYLAMELVSGEGLDQAIQRKKSLEAIEAVKIALELAECLDYVHQSGILHRDIKPQNILLGKKGRARLNDFGLAKELSGTSSVMTKTGQFLGTLGYVSPEQARGDLEKVDERSDVYSLGATLYHMLTGIPPHFDRLKEIETKGNGQVLAAVMEVATGKPTWPHKIRPKLAAYRDLESVVMKSLEKEQSMRFQSAAELSEALKRSQKRTMLWPLFQLLNWFRR